MTRTICFFALAVFICHADASAQVVNKKLSGQSFTAEITVNCEASKVWGILTDLQKISEIMQYDYSGEQKFSDLGANEQLKIWGDTGTYIMTYNKPQTELRLTWDPDNATYLCQSRWHLTEAGKTTKVLFEERYTESGAQSE